MSTYCNLFKTQIFGLLEKKLQFKHYGFRMIHFLISHYESLCINFKKSKNHVFYCKDSVVAIFFRYFLH